MVNYKDAIAWARALIGTPYSELDCINLIKAVIRRAPGGMPNYTTAHVPALWASYKASPKYRDLAERHEDITHARAGWLVFKGKPLGFGGQPQHVGLATGEGTVIHSSSVKGQAVETPLTAREGWTLCARHRYIKTEEDEDMPQTEVQYTAQVTTESGKLRMRSGPGKSYPVITSIPKGETVDVLMEYDTGWDFIRYANQTGYASAEYLTPINAPEAPSEPPEAPDVETPTGMTWGVFLPNLGREKAEKIAAEYPGAILTAYQAGGND